VNRKVIAIVAVLAVVLIASAVWYFHDADSPDVIVLHGNVDLRQVDLPFNDSERIAEVLVEEGSSVHTGEVLARLQTGRLLPRVNQAQAQVAAQSEGLRKLRNGARPEEIAQARAALAAADAEAANARSQLERLQSISDASQGRAVSTQDLEAATTQERMSEAQAQLDAAQAQLALLQQQLKDAELVSPVDGVVRNRLMEPGELATPQRPVFSIAIAHPKWVRAYVSETDLGRIAPGMKASITTDSAPQTPVEGSISFISSSAEFTPKTVQTEELRTSLVYEVRILVQDPDDRLRLGMPATVSIDTAQRTASTSTGAGS
jgi:HlyD family secretion protein